MPLLRSIKGRNDPEEYIKTLENLRKTTGLDVTNLRNNILGKYLHVYMARPPGGKAAEGSFGRAPTTTQFDADYHTEGFGGGLLPYTNEIELYNNEEVLHRSPFKFWASAYYVPESINKTQFFTDDGGPTSARLAKAFNTSPLLLTPTGEPNRAVKPTGSDSFRYLDNVLGVAGFSGKNIVKSHGEGDNFWQEHYSHDLKDELGEIDPKDLEDIKIDRSLQSYPEDSFTGKIFKRIPSANPDKVKSLIRGVTGVAERLHHTRGPIPNIKHFNPTRETEDEHRRHSPHYLSSQFVRVSRADQPRSDEYVIADEDVIDLNTGTWAEMHPDGYFPT